MAVQQSQLLPAPFLTDVTKDYAKRLGAVVSATDVRAATKEQVESLGGKFIMVEDNESINSETKGGYAKEMSDEYKKKQNKLI